MAIVVDPSTPGGTATSAAGVVAEPRVVEADVSEAARQLRPLSFPTGQHVSERIDQQVNVPPGVTFQFSNLPPGLSFNQSTTAINGTPTTPGTWDVTATAYLAGIPVETATSRVTITGDPVAPAPGGGNGGGGNGGGGGGAPAPAPGGGGGGAPAPTHAAGIELATVDTLPLPPEVKQAVKDGLINFDRAMEDFWAQMPPMPPMPQGS